MKRRNKYSMPEFQGINMDGVSFASEDICPTQVTMQDGRVVPVLITDEREDNSQPTVLFAQAWSAGIEQPYQKVRTKTLAHYLGARAVVPNTFEMGTGSPKMTNAERIAIRKGNAGLIGKLAVHASLNAIESEGQDAPTSVDIVATSQGPVLVPGMIAGLREKGVEVNTVNLFTPASNRVGGRLIHLPGLMRDMLLNAPKRMKDYRAQNPDYLTTKRAKDTNIIRSLLTQARSHLWSYPVGMLRQDLGTQVANAYRGAERTPHVNIFAAEHDRVSRLHRNKKLVDRLNELGIDASLHVMDGQHHSVTEHVPYMASLIGSVIRPDTIA